LDRSLKGLVSALASNLLSTSTQFEPYIPNSKQNLYYSLNLLSGLGDLARMSLEGEALKPPPQSPTSSLAQTTTPAQVTKESRPEGLSLPHFPRVDDTPPILTQPSLTSKERSREVDRSLLEALQALRESKQFQRKTMGVFSPILRGNL